MVLKLSTSSATCELPVSPTRAWERMLTEMLARSMGWGVFSCCPEDYSMLGLLAPGSSDSAAWAEGRRGHSFAHSCIHPITHPIMHHACTHSFLQITHSFTDALIHSLTPSLTRLPMPALVLWVPTPSIRFRFSLQISPRSTPPTYCIIPFIVSVLVLPHPLSWLECQLQAILS